MYIFVYTQSVHPCIHVRGDGIFRGWRNSTFYDFLGIHQFYICACEKPKNLWEKRERKTRIPCDCVSAADDFFIVRLYYTAVEFPRPETPSRKSHRIAHAHVRGACMIRRFINNTVLPVFGRCTGWLLIVCGTALVLEMFINFCYHNCQTVSIFVRHHYDYFLVK